MKIIEKIKKILNKLINFNLFSEAEDIVCYICGNDALPLPLDQDEEILLLDELHKGNKTAREKLIEHNLRLVVYIAKRFENCQIEMEDLISVGAIGLIKAINTFDTEKNIKLATYASRCIENEILMQIRKVSRIRGEVSIDEPLSLDGEGNELLLSDVLYIESDSVTKNLDLSVEKQLLWSQIERLNRREREIMIMRFGLQGKDEKTQKEVADSLGISQSYISRIEKKILDRLKKELQNII